MSGNRKPVIVFISHWAASLGGAELSLADIMASMTQRTDVHLITTETGALVTMAQKSGVTCHVLPSSAALMHIRRNHLSGSLLSNIPATIAFLRYVIAVRTCIMPLQPYCIHANVPKSHITLFLLRVVGVRCRGVIHFREIFAPHSAVKAVYNTLYLLAKRPDVIAISKAVHAALPRTMQQRAVTIYNGVTVITSNRHPRKLAPVRFLYLGRVVPWKGCEFLITTFLQLVRQHNSDAYLSIVGSTSYWDRSYRNRLSALINRSSASARISLHEHTSALAEVFAAHDVLCLPSHNEPFGRVAAEALGSAMPVIAWHSGGLPEIVTHRETGILTPAGDGDAFVAAMKFFIDNRHEMYRMGTNGRERVLRHFNRDIQVPLLANYLAPSQQTTASGLKRSTSGH